MAESYDKFQVFTFNFNDEELEEQFHKFFNKYNLNAMFTLEHEAPEITVNDMEARRVSNVERTYTERYLNKNYDPTKNKQKQYYTRTRHVKEGDYAKYFKDFADYLHMANDNKMYDLSVFKLIYKAKTLTELLTIIKKVMKYIDNGILDKHKFNTWNILYYNKEVY